MVNDMGNIILKRERVIIKYAEMRNRFDEQSCCNWVYFWTVWTQEEDDGVGAR